MVKGDYVKVHKGKDGQWYVTLMAANHQARNSSEGYRSRWYAKHTAEKVYPTLEIVVE